MTIPFSQADVVVVVGGAVRYKQLTEQDYDPLVDTDLFTAWAPAATAAAEGILMIGFDSVARVRALMVSDANVRMSTARICAGMMGSTKQDMTNADGSYPYMHQEDLGRRDLDELARAAKQSPAQQDNPLVGQHDRTKSGNVKEASLNKKIFVSPCPGVHGKGGF